MNLKIVLLVVLIASVFLFGCQAGTGTTGAATQQQQQGQYVGGGCGVAPSGNVEDTDVESLQRAGFVL